MIEKDGSVVNGQNKFVDGDAKDTEEKGTGQSSLTKSVRRLKKSRDGWKYKNKGNRDKIKALKIKARDLNNSRTIWKERAKQAEAKLQEANDLLAQLGAGETAKKN